MSDKDRKAPAERILSAEDMVRLSRASLPAFSRWPLGLRDEYEPWECQKDWMRRAQEAYLAKLDPKTAGDARHLCLLAPSEHGKTTAMAVPFILWLLSRNRNLRILVAGSKEDLAANVGYGIDRHFANRSEALELFGLKAGWPWNNTEKFVQRDNDNIIHPSMLFVGPEVEMQGKRADVIVLTDLATFKNCRTAESRAKLLDFIDHTLMPRLEPWGFILAEGHHVNHEDLYTEFECREDEWRVLRYKAILEEPSEDNHGKAKILAPEQWTYKQLSRIRARRPAVFQLIYQNVPVETKGLVNREVLEKGLDRSRPLLHTMPQELRGAYKQIAMGVDPAFSISRWSAFSACLLWGVAENGHRDLLGGWRLRLLPHLLRSKIAATIKLWRPDVCFIEANAAQVFLVADVRALLGDLGRVVRPVYTGGNNPEDTVEQAVSDCVTTIETGNATFPYLGADAQELTEQLFTEILNFPSGRFTDVMMAWQIMERGLKKTGAEERRTVRFQGICRAVHAAAHPTLNHGRPWTYAPPL